MCNCKHFIIEDVSSGDSKPFAVVTHGEAFDGRFKRKVLFITGWCETEDEARLLRDLSNNPSFR